VKAKLPDDEARRLEALRRYDVLDTPAERAFDDLTGLASQVCGTPISLVSLVDAERQWFKSRVGVDLTETPREFSFCAHTILGRDVLVVSDTLADARFSDNPFVLAPPNIRFYAAAPLVTPEGYRLGTLCVMDVTPRTLEDAARGALEALARQAVAQLEIRRLAAELLAARGARDATLEALRSAEDRFRSLFENLPIGFYQTTPDGRIIAANRSLLRMLGYASFEELSRRNLEQDFEADYSRAAFRERLERDGEIRGLEVTWTRRDGTTLWLRENAKVLRNSDGSVLCYEGTIEDISERKRVEKAKEELASIVSHELRTPLTSIRGTLEWLAVRIPHGLPPKAARAVDIARSAARRMERLIGDLLDMERLESGRTAFDLRPVPLGPILAHAIDANEPYARELHVRLAYAGCEPGLRVSVDADRLIQVVTNLLSNATRFSTPGAVVTVSVARHDGNVKVSVVDRGPGIPEAFQSRVFERFARGHAADPRHKGGSGLGLSITRAIVEKLGGHIGFVTEAGAGTTFYFDLPEYRES